MKNPIFSQMKYKILSVLLLITLLPTALYFTYQYMKTTDQHGTDLEKNPLMKPSPKTVSSPVFLLDLDVPILLKEYKKWGREKIDSKGLKSFFQVLSNLKAENFCVYFIPDTVYQTLPVIIIKSKGRNYVNAFLQEEATAFFVRIDDNEFRLKTETIDKLPFQSFPFPIYRLKTIDNRSIIIAPENLLNGLGIDMTFFSESEISNMAKSIKMPKDMTVMTARIPEKIPLGWENEIPYLSGIREDSNIEVVIGVMKNILNLLTPDLKKIEFIGCGFQFKNGKERSLSYVQKFRNQNLAKSVYRQFVSGTWAKKKSYTDSLMQILINENIRRKVRLKGTWLAMDLKWSSVDEEKIFRKLWRVSLKHIFYRKVKSRLFGKTEK